MAGKTMIQRVYEQAWQARRLDRVLVATDDARIFDHVVAFGGEARMTSAEHPSGTDRCAEVARDMEEYALVVNIQGDEPFIDPSQIDAVVEPLQRGEGDIVTLATPIDEAARLFDPNVVKVVMNSQGRAMYFSRAAIPHCRQASPEEWLLKAKYYQHVGLYAYTREALMALGALPPSLYEQAESLEQLRWLEAGYSIVLATTPSHSAGIDTPEDLARALATLPDAP
jgi:3-deoxy-manno-octulosonate cytidylyltransferase (CMP-KDO synthetase)